MLIIQNATIYTCNEKRDVLPQGDILIQDGRILEIGKTPEGLDARIFNASGLSLYPGFVDAHSHIGGESMNFEEQDINEMTAPSTPDLQVLDVIDFSLPFYDYARKAGITSCCITPGSGNVICGLACAVKTWGSECLKNPVAMKMAMGGNPKGVYGPRHERPMTRMGIAQIIRSELQKAREYLRDKASGKDIPYDAGLENLGLVLRREIPIKVHCEQFDMLTVQRIAKEFEIEYTLEHAWGASDYYDELMDPRLKGIIFGPIGVMMLPGEIGKVDIESLVELDRRGKCCAIMTDGPILNPDLLVYQAGEVLRFGGDYLRVLQMLTLNPAKILGVEKRVGSLEKGKDADLVLFRGKAVEDPRAKVAATLVNGTFVYEEEKKGVEKD